MGNQHGLIAPSEIAEMAGVSRAAVSNWRATERGSDFPDPAGGSEARPLFDLDEVTAWLIAHNYTITQDRGERLIWSTLNRFRGQWSVEDLSEVVMGVLTARRLASESSALHRLWTSLTTDPNRITDAFEDFAQAAGDEKAAWSDLVRFPDHINRQGRQLVAAIYYAVDTLESANLEAVANYVLGRVTAAQARSAGEFGLVNSRVAQLLSGLVATTGTGVVYDPACGIAETLIDVHKRNPKLRLIGHDINSDALRRARQRCLLAGIDADFVLSDVLAQDPDPMLKADLVLVEPPFGLRWNADQAVADPRWIFGLPPKSSSEALWIQHSIHHLRTRGRAYVITSTGPLFRTAEQNIRTALLNKGCVEAIVGLPGKMLPHTSIPLTLWVLCRPGESPDPESVLIIDATQEQKPEKYINEWLTESSTIGSIHPPSARVAIRDLLVNNSRLQPQLWVGQPDIDTSEIASAYRHAATAVATTAAALQHDTYPVQDPLDFSTPRLVTVKELMKQGAAEIYQGRHMGSDITEAETALVTPRDVRDGLRSEDRPGRTNRSAATSGAMTEPGDVLLTTMNEIRAVVDEEGGHLLANGVYALRVDQTRCDPAYLAYLLTGSWNGRHQVGTTIRRAHVKELEVPLIPLAEQRHAVSLLKAAEKVRQQARALTDAANSLTASLLEVIRHDVAIHHD